MPAESTFQPRTAREALLEIRRRIELVAQEKRVSCADLDEVAIAGLDGGHGDFEDRLAEAHKVLRVFDSRRNGEREDQHVAEALALPPDIEAMVERRIGPQ